MTVEELNALPDEVACETLAACCGAPAWVARMAAARPFAGRAALVDAAELAWRGLEPHELHAAIAHHPRLGESRTGAPLGARERAWSSDEQSGARSADEATRGQLAEGNAAYERRFGHAFILCASGKTAQEILDALRTRLTGDATEELATTREELRKITLLRLDKLLAAS